MTARKRAKTKRHRPLCLSDLAAQWRKARTRYVNRPKEFDFCSEEIRAADKIAYEAFYGSERQRAKASK